MIPFCETFLNNILLAERLSYSRLLIPFELCVTSLLTVLLSVIRLLPIHCSSLPLSSAFLSLLITYAFKHCIIYHQRVPFLTFPSLTFSEQSLAFHLGGHYNHAAFISFNIFHMKRVPLHLHFRSMKRLHDVPCSPSIT